MAILLNHVNISDKVRTFYIVFAFVQFSLGSREELFWGNENRFKHAQHTVECLITACGFATCTFNPIHSPKFWLIFTYFICATF